MSIKKLNQAKILVDKIRKDGHKISINGSWIKYEPPVSVEILLEVSILSDQIKELIETDLTALTGAH